MLQSSLCDYNDAYIGVKGTVTIENTNNAANDKKLAFKDKALIISCISKINNTLIDNEEDLGIVVPMYNLIEYSKNCKKITGSLYNYYRDELNSGTEGTINYSIEDSKSSDYKTSNTGKLEDNNLEKEDAEIAVSLEHVSNFWRTTTY